MFDVRSAITESGSVLAHVEDVEAAQAAIGDARLCRLRCNGAIAVESRPGRTVFTLTLPAARRAAPVEFLLNATLTIGRSVPAVREVPLGEGKVDWAAYLKALTEIGFKGYLTIEREVGADPAADIRKAVQFLRQKIGA